MGRCGKGPTSSMLLHLNIAWTWITRAEPEGRGRHEGPQSLSAGFRPVVICMTTTVSRGEMFELRDSSRSE